MINLKKAVKLAKENNGTMGVGAVAHDIGNAWIFDYAGEVDEAPVMVNKEDGSVSAFFPPDYPVDAIDKARKIDISRYL